jgi:hypothetical protein
MGNNNTINTVYTSSVALVDSILFSNVGGTQTGLNNYVIGTSSTVQGGQLNVGIGVSGLTFPVGQNDNVAIGRVSGIGATTSNSITIGLVASMGSNCNDTVVIGRQASASTGSQNSVAIGREASVTVSNAVAVGAYVTADRENYVAVTELDVKTVGGGIIMYSPDGTAYKLTVANGGTLSVAAV